jgi:hypothetical protein
MVPSELMDTSILIIGISYSLASAEEKERDSKTSNRVKQKYLEVSIVDFNKIFLG